TPVVLSANRMIETYTNNAIPLDSRFLAAIDPSSEGTIGIGANNAVGVLDLSAHPNLRVGSAQNLAFWGHIIPAGSAYQLGGMGPEARLTSNTGLQIGTLTGNYDVVIGATGAVTLVAGNSFSGRLIVTNGDQTDTVIDYLKAGKSWQEALMTRTFEPDAPNYTPRITGIMDLKAPWAYALSILKSQDGDEGHCLRHFYFYEKALYGYGHCIHTYQGDGNPLPSFSGEPYIMPVPENPEKACQLYWSLLNEENRISLLAKYIDVETGKFEIRMINRHGA
ncbi:MAG TPA: IMP cyclohydrolase, partial [Thermoclostridium caenicola]|nr:IMP cyclohydrolase [Thermoclostridium caenicola]